MAVDRVLEWESEDSLTSKCITFYQSLYLFQPRFLHLDNGGNSACLTSFVERVKLSKVLRIIKTYSNVW